MLNVKTVIKVGRSGRAQIPIEIREKMDISDGDQLVIEIEQVIKTSCGMEATNQETVELPQREVA